MQMRGSMNYREALDYIHGMNRFGIKLGLENTMILLELLGNPQERMQFIHVAGTNGKGSVSAYLASVMEASGKKTGLYTSPYIQRFTERIRVDGAEISEEAVARWAGFVRDKIDDMVASGRNHPTEFEALTALALCCFAEENCDVVVLETGMGGRFDATNVIANPLVSVITTIDYDHMEYLGDTIEKIAYEKAGIIKKGCSVVSYPQRDTVLQVLEQAAAEKGAELVVSDFSTLECCGWSVDGQSFHYKAYRDLNIAMLGEYQMYNAALAIDVIEVMNRRQLTRISGEALRKGLAMTRWPGRMEIARQNPLFVIDAAHNTQGAGALREALLRYFPDRKIAVIFGVLKDKEYRAVIEQVIPLAEAVFTVTPDTPRAMAADELSAVLQEMLMEATGWAEVSGGSDAEADVRRPDTRQSDARQERASAWKTVPERIWACESVEEATMRSLAYAEETGAMVCAFGSLYYIGEVRTCLGL